ncbi:GntR family transcriptional regulator [Xylanimonas oleitrophica]|uniref:GntR family transcriptional regulator n=1 Tax=Xylanimonas oleitrophica TaxID=2607479 RepID=A0A2W5WPL7_9MICO|nr:FadR/GntR family transcriptional regulator [Xylanimonas oleitrophica]PZR52633.1 GntR family transcriptional regulator [Xylanimonas oleitrophica]
MRTHERVLAQIEADLASGKWGLGERLPGERALAEQMGVSRPSVREAMRVLEAMGIVRTAVGSGPEAGATVIDRPAAGLGAAVRLHVASGTLPVEDVVATRTALETWAVAQAAERLASEEDLQEVRELLAALDEPGISTAEFVRRDQDFHIALVRLGGNQLVEAILSGLRTAIGSYVTAGAERLPSWETTSARLCTEHKAIVAAVAERDGERAEKLAHQHIWGFYEETGLASASAEG